MEQGSGEGEVEVVECNAEADVEGHDAGVEVEEDVSDGLNVAVDNVFDTEGQDVILDVEEAASGAGGHDAAAELEEGASALLAVETEEGQAIAGDDSFHFEFAQEDRPAETSTHTLS